MVIICNSIPRFQTLSSYLSLISGSADQIPSSLSHLASYFGNDVPATWSNYTMPPEKVNEELFLETVSRQQFEGRAAQLDQRNVRDQAASTLKKFEDEDLDKSVVVARSWKEGVGIFFFFLAPFCRDWVSVSCLTGQLPGIGTVFILASLQMCKVQRQSPLASQGGWGGRRLEAAGSGGSCARRSLKVGGSPSRL